LAGLLMATLFVFGMVIWRPNWLLRSILNRPISVNPSENFFSQPVKVSLSSPLRGQIHYTLDGTIPTNNSPIYTQPLDVSQSAILQTAVFIDDNLQTNIQSHDFFINTKHNIPIVSINLPPESLWDDEIGIYVEGIHNNYRQTGSDWERSAWMRWYEPDHKLGFERLIGLRLHGNAMRGMPQKAFRIYVRDEQGREVKLTYPLFGEAGNRQHSSFVLRNSSSDMAHTFMRDRLASELVQQSDSNLDTQSARPVVLYLNGQYWGLYYLRERFDETYFSEKYQVDPELLSIVEVPLNNAEKRGQAISDSKKSQADADLYNQLLSDIRRCRDCVDFNHLDRLVDTNNLIDYFLFEFFFANADWPYNNTKAWRYRSPTNQPVESQLQPELDGRFRWLLFDVDVGFGAGRDSTEKMIKVANNNPYTNFEDHAFPFRNMFFNQTFQQHWQARLNELTANVLSQRNLVQTAEALAAEIRPEMSRHIERWGKEAAQDGVDSVDSLTEWEVQVELLKDFLRTRTAAFQDHTQEFIKNSHNIP